MKKLIGSFAAFVVRCTSLFLVITSSFLLINHDCVRFCVLSLSLIVRGKQEFFEYLPDQVLLLNDAITDSLVSLGDDFTRQCDQTYEQSLLLIGELQRLYLVFLSLFLDLLLSALYLFLSLDLVDYLVKEIFWVVNCNRV